MKIFTFKNMFTLMCSILTLILIYQVLFTYVVEKPTTTSEEEKELEVGDFPEVVVCLDTGLSYETLIKYGYHSTYPLGQMKPYGKFIGWNGGEQVNKSSRDILEEALLVPDSWRSGIDESPKSKI